MHICMRIAFQNIRRLHINTDFRLPNSYFPFKNRDVCMGKSEFENDIQVLFPVCHVYCNHFSLRQALNP